MKQIINDNDNLVEKGIAAYEEKDYKKTLEFFMKITSDFDQYDIIKGEIIGLNYNLKNYEEVIRLSEYESENNESYSVIIANKMWAYIKLKRYQEVIEFYNKSTFIIDEDAKKHYYKAIQNAAVAVKNDVLASDMAKLLDNMYILEDEDSTTYIAI